jgi:alkanesulfonate monooxygenase SsuD/methylene tetrahydromethanopterin reductase-like flavin-dependent oxidoreductase (luciferase family)
MKFGLFGGISSSGGTEVSGYLANYEGYIQAVVDAEALGFHSNFLVEHHFTGMGQVSASLSLLTYLAARTSRIRLGTAVVVLPWHNPVLIAEQAATLDLLSHGRFDFGVGKGYRFSEFEGFQIPIEEAAERFEEVMTVIRAAWTTEGRFSHQGKRWTFKDIVVEPATTQKPHPPFWMAAGRPESLQAAAWGGYNLLLDQFQTLEVALERLALYRQSLAEVGRVWDPMGAAVARALYITNTPAERDAAVAARIRQLNFMNAHGRSADGKQRSSMVSDDDLLKATEQGVLIGTPVEIIERLHRLGDAGVGYVLLSPQTEGAMRVFAEKIMPALADRPHGLVD